VYGYPPVLAAEIAVREVTTFLAAGSNIEQVVLVAFDAPLGDILTRAVRTHGGL
jgi:O-acetyl-ADP-ribose deacetylase (regulator of RNase III)